MLKVERYRYSKIRSSHLLREVENPPHVSKERSHELVDATHGPLDMAECYVKGSQVKLKFATRTFRAQVISCLFVFCLEVSKTKETGKCPSNIRRSNISKNTKGKVTKLTRDMKSQPFPIYSPSHAHQLKKIATSGKSRALETT